MEDLAKDYSLKKWCKRLKHDFTVSVTAPDFPKRIRISLGVFCIIFIFYSISGCQRSSILVENIELLPPEHYSNEIYEPSVVEIRSGLSRLTLDRRAEHWKNLFVSVILSLFFFFTSKEEKSSIEKSQQQDQPNPHTSGPVV